MNIFGIGTWELLLILVIALIVAGPQRMLQWAYMFGRLMAQVRVLWGQAMDAVQSELDQAGVDVKVPKDFSRKEISRSVGEFTKPFTDEVRKAEKEYRDQINAVESEVKSTTKDAEAEIKELDKSVKSATRTNPKPRENAVTRNDTRSTAREGSNGNAAAAAASADSSNGFGTWSGSAAKPADDTASSSGDDSGFGTWSSSNTDAPDED